MWKAQPSGWHRCHLLPQQRRRNWSLAHFFVGSPISKHHTRRPSATQFPTISASWDSFSLGCRFPPTALCLLTTARGSISLVIVGGISETCWGGISWCVMAGRVADWRARALPGPSGCHSAPADYHCAEGWLSFVRTLAFAREARVGCFKCEISQVLNVGN